MAKTTANYEVMYIVDLDKGEEGVAAIVEKFKTLIEENGTITAQTMVVPLDTLRVRLRSS